MNKFYVPIFIFLLVVSATVPLYAQNSTGDKQPKSEQPFIRKGIFLTGFSFALANASSSQYYLGSREVTGISLELDGLYFLNKHFGIGPLLEYQFTYEDFGPRYQESSLRGNQLVLGAQIGYYIPVTEIFSGNSDINFFVDAAMEGIRNSSINQKSVYEFGLQAGVGFLFPVGKRIALQTKLGFQTQRQRYTLYSVNQSDQPRVKSIIHKWPVNVGISLGLRVTF